MAGTTNRYSTYSPQDRSLRASDHDREAIGDFLRRQHVEGRLDADEFADRYGRCLEAKTYAQLDGLIADLPFDGRAAYQAGPEAWGSAAWGGGASGGGASGDTAWAARRWRAGRRLLRVPLFAWVILFLALAASGHFWLWLAFPLFFFFVLRPLIWRSAWRAAGPGPGWGRRGPWGPWGCRSGFSGPSGPTV
ncbi:MAG TPA: DUF1707 domain-containing protein [Acidimicrobiales bacterium]|nr:DUF1707 domain-containing protein [Acidimicrobiales bacterium]